MVSDETRAEIQREYFAPIMDIFITMITPDNLTEAIENNWDQSKFLTGTPEGQETLKTIREYLQGIKKWTLMGWIDQAIEEMKKPELLKWYVYEVLSETHPDYFMRIAYNPNGMKYLLTTWPKCLDVIW